MSVILVLFPFLFLLPLFFLLKICFPPPNIPEESLCKTPSSRSEPNPLKERAGGARSPKLLLGGRPGASRDAGIISPFYVGGDGGGVSPAEIPVIRR